MPVKANSKFTIQYSPPSATHPALWLLVILLLPLISACSFGDDSTPAAPAGPQPTGGTTEFQRSILVVDDEDLVRRVIRDVLRKKGYLVGEARDGSEAMQVFAQANPRFDLVLLDIRMPRMNGWETMEQIKALDPAAKVILLGGAILEEEMAQAKAKGADALLPKPFKPQELQELVEKTVGTP